MSGLVRVLLAEDEAADAEIVKRLLSRRPYPQFEIEWTDTLERTAYALSSRRVDVLLLDLGLSGTRNLEGLTRIQGIDIRVPIIIVTGKNDRALALLALQNGAQDYLIKGRLTTDNLVRAIQYATERHRLVQHLAEARVTLEDKNKRLAKLYRTAHKFVDNVSHEFRTPLTVIKEYVSLIKDGVVGGVTSEQCRMLTAVEARADDLNTMVDDMLDVSKLEAGLLCVHRTECSAADVLEHVQPVLDSKAAARGVRLECNVDVGLPRIYCDIEKAGRVLINLTINAIKFCGTPGNVRISCRKRVNMPGVEFNVTDNGPGISSADQQALFGRFTQLSESVRSSSKGFGLGLSIAKELAEANLGDISVDSEPERGSTFSFTLPPADSAEVMRRYLQRLGKLRNAPRHLTLVQMAIAESAADLQAEEVGRFLSCLLRYNDLLLRVDSHRWLLVLPVSQTEAPAFRQRAEKAISDAGRNRVGDPLAEIDFQYLGTWRVTARQEILGRLHAVSRHKEIAHV